MFTVWHLTNKDTFFCYIGVQIRRLHCICGIIVKEIPVRLMPYSVWLAEQPVSDWQLLMYSISEVAVQLYTEQLKKTETHIPVTPCKAVFSLCWLLFYSLRVAAIFILNSIFGER